jgi:2-polyprenyl-6-hydroxyphenyl methylase/3-demethylubiquinone-9 3-methyltransferase
MLDLGSWDIVYSWGVLHHTGQLWEALDTACRLVPPKGRLFIAIYNDQGVVSTAWRVVKRIYNALPRFVRPAFVLVASLPIELRVLARCLVERRPGDYIDLWRAEGDYERGMSRWHDLVDWVGGYPFEVATAGEVIEFCRSRDFEVTRTRTVGRSNGCNEFVFEAAGARRGK